MNRIKSTVAVLLLFVITVIVVFGPHIVNRQSDKKLTEETAYWNYNNQNASKITDKQVAALYYNGKIDVDVYDRFDAVYGKNDGTVNIEDSIRKDVLILFDYVFAKNETICACMKEMFGGSDIIFSQTEVLTMIDERPIVLNVVCVIAQTVHGTIEITYEQKSHTLLNFAYYSVFPLDETNSIKSEKLVEIVSRYYTNGLELNNTQFYAYYETVEKDDFKNYCVWFGIFNFQNEIQFDKEDDGVNVLPF